MSLKASRDLGYDWGPFARRLFNNKNAHASRFMIG